MYVVIHLVLLILQICTAYLLCNSCRCTARSKAMFPLPCLVECVHAPGTLPVVAEPTTGSANCGIYPLCHSLIWWWWWRWKTWFCSEVVWIQTPVLTLPWEPFLISLYCSFLAFKSRLTIASPQVQGVSSDTPKLIIRLFYHPTLHSCSGAKPADMAGLQGACSMAWMSSFRSAQRVDSLLTYIL